MGLYPYADRYPVERNLPQSGRSRDEILAEIEAMSALEDAAADEGKISGSIYSGDHEHYAFLNEVFGHYSHANVLQRDMYPERDPVRGRDHRDDRRLDARAGAVRGRHQRRHREPDEPAARVPRVGPRSRDHHVPTW